MKKVFTILCLALLTVWNASAQETPKTGNGEPKKIVASKRSNKSRKKSNLGPTNMLRISPFGLVNKLKLHYEKIVSPRSAFAIAGSIYYSDLDKGSIKIEPHYKFYTSATAPSGAYIIGGPTIFMLNNYNFRYTASSEQQAIILANQPFFNAVTKDALITTFAQNSFASVGGCLGFGYQSIFGKGNNFVFDFAVGYQYVPLPSNIKEPITKEMTYQGSNKVYTYEINYLFSDKKNFAGITSPIFTKLSIGILF